MARKIDTDAEIDSIRLAEQAGDVVAVDAGYWHMYAKEGGLYLEDDNEVAGGPLGVAFEPGGRLTLTTAVPVTTSDVNNAVTLYYTPYKHNMISLYDGARWIPVPFVEKSLDISGFTASKPYDIFGYLASGTLALEGLVWTDATTRATALAYQNGRLVKSGATTRLYLGSIYMAADQKCDDSVTTRYVWNNYNRVMRRCYKSDATSHTYTTAAWRAWNNSTANAFQILVGVQEEVTMLSLIAQIQANADNIQGYITIGYDVTNAEIESYFRVSNANLYAITLGEAMPHLTGAGLHTYTILEYGATTNTFGLFSMWGAYPG